MAAAAISVPVIILAAMLLVRMFVFYLEILTKGIDEHREAMEAQDSYRGIAMRTYRDSEEISLAKGGLLARSVSKRLETKAYLINEDLLVRSGEIAE